MNLHTYAERLWAIAQYMPYLCVHHLRELDREFSRLAPQHGGGRNYQFRKAIVNMVRAELATRSRAAAHMPRELVVALQQTGYLPDSRALTASFSHGPQNEQFAPDLPPFCPLVTCPSESAQGCHRGVLKGATELKHLLSVG